MKKVLLTDGMAPFQLGWGEDMFDLLGARLTRAQGPHTLRADMHAFALYIIAENIPAYTRVMERPDEKILRKELKNGYDYIGIQVITRCIPNIAAMLKIIKEVSPESKIVLGGYGLLSLHEPLPHDPDNLAGYILENADYECFEEGVSFFRKLLGADPDELVTQNHQPLGYATIPGLENSIQLPLSSTLVALGCPNACEFCNTSAFYKAQKLAVANPEQTSEYLKSAFLKMNGVASIFDMIWDEDFLLDKPFVMKLGEYLQRENLVSHVNIFCFGSIRSISQYTIDELLLCGIGMIWIGVESKFDECFTGEHNFTKREGRDVKEIFTELHDNGIQVIASNILGLDFHDKENLYEDIDYFVSLKPDLYQISPLTPCPGTKLYGRMKEQGRLFDHYSWKDFSLWKDDIFQLKNFGKNELKEYFDYAHKSLYETNGPTLLNIMDVSLQGYRKLVHSQNPHLQARAQRYYKQLDGLLPKIIHSLKVLAPSDVVREKAEDVERRFFKYIRNYTLWEKIVQRFCTSQIKKRYKIRQAMVEQGLPDPPWIITEFFGDKSKPRVVARRNPVQSLIKSIKTSIAMRFTNFNKIHKPTIRLADIDSYPFDCNTIEIEGDLMSYVDEGEGDVILMLHGNATWSFLYRDYINDLKKDHRCIAPDYLGFGLSDKPQDADYSMDAHIRRLGKFVDKMGLENITLVCQDWGGVTGLSYAALNKEKFKRLIIMNTSAFLPSSLKDLARCLRAFAFPYLWLFRIPVLGKMMGMDWNIFLKFGMWLGIHNSKRQLHKKAKLGYLYPFQKVANRTAILAAVRQVPIGPFGPIWRLLRKTEKAITGWDIRTQLIWGTKDPVFVPWFLEKFEKVLPNHAPSLKIPTASHYLQDDEPEIILSKIREFLAKEKKAGKVHDAKNKKVAVSGRKKKSNNEARVNA